MATKRNVGGSETAVSVRRVVTRFALTGFVALLIVSMITAIVSARVGTDQAIEEAKQVTFISAQGVIAPALSDGVTTQDAEALQEIDDAVRQYVLRGSLVRVKIWDVDGRILYSDESRLIGEQFELDDDKIEVFSSGGSRAEVSNLDSPENRFETETKLLEVYQLVETETGIPMLFEAYFRYSGVTDVGRRLWGQFAPIAIGALIALQLVQLPFAWNMARRLRDGQQDRERLLRRAIDASEAERRRIASDLHDGVVQDLTGVSFGLAALGRSEEIDPKQATEASASIRTAIKSLRSLLVEIYPPNLHEEGLESAIGDLLSGLPSRGVVTHFTAELGDKPVTPEAAGLIYRVTQEALRNVVSHSSASAVNVDLHRADHEISVVIDDNGRGFDVSEVNQQQSKGHVGLRSLSGLIADSGGQLEVRSAEGVGTRIEAHVPVDMGAS